jgi:hypothetical protein
MDIDEQIRSLLAVVQETSVIARENSEGIKELLKTTKEHTRQPELDGRYIKQLAMIVDDHQGEITKMTNSIQAPVELAALHETRLNRMEGGEA